MSGRLRRQALNGLTLSAGDRVRLSENVLHTEFRGLTGSMVKYMKSRRVIVVKLYDKERQMGYIPLILDDGETLYENISAYTRILRFAGVYHTEGGVKQAVEDSKVSVFVGKSASGRKTCSGFNTRNCRPVSASIIQLPIKQK